jgi:hypothetical protein
VSGDIYAQLVDEFDAGAPQNACAGEPLPNSYRRPLPLVLEVVTQPTPKTRRPRYSTVYEALCRTRTGDPFLNMAARQMWPVRARQQKYL